MNRIKKEYNKINKIMMRVIKRLSENLLTEEDDFEGLRESLIKWLKLLPGVAYYPEHDVVCARDGVYETLNEYVSETRDTIHQEIRPWSYEPDHPDFLYSGWCVHWAHEDGFNGTPIGGHVCASTGDTEYLFSRTPASHHFVFYKVEKCPGFDQDMWSDKTGHCALGEDEAPVFGCPERDELWVKGEHIRECVLLSFAHPSEAKEYLRSLGEGVKMAPPRNWSWD